MKPENDALPSIAFKLISIELSVEQIGEENGRECSQFVN